MWNRREILLGVGALAACNGASSAPKEKPVSSPAVPPTPVRPSTNEDPGFVVATAPATFLVDGDRIAELTASGLVLRERSGKEVATVAISGGKSLAVLSDHTIAVATGKQVVVVKGTAIESTFGSYVPVVAATTTPTELWAIDGNLVTRQGIGTGARAGRLVPVKGYPLPEGRRSGYAVLGDGSFVVEHQKGVYRAAPSGELTLHASELSVRHLAPGPAPSQLWCTATGKVLVAALEPDKLVITTTYALGAGATILHFAAAGPRAAAIIATGEGPAATAAVAGFDPAKGEVWRAAVPIGGELGVAMDARTVVVKAGATLHVYDAATGAPVR